MVISKLNTRFIYWAIAFSIAGVLLYFSLRGLNWKQVGVTLSRANVAYIGVSLLIASFSLLMRAIRWGILLRAGAAVTLPTAFWATSAGYFGNNFLPARAGEFVRTVIVSARTGLSKTFVLTTAFTERLADAVTLVVLSSIVLLTLTVKPGWFQGAARPFAIVGLCGVACIGVLPRMENIWRAVIDRLPFPQQFRAKLQLILEQILNGLRTLHDWRRFCGFAGLALVIWFSDAIGTIIVMRALGLSISIPIAFLLLTGLGLSSALPATPGYVGIYQFVAVNVLVPFGFSRPDAIAFSLLAQVMQYVLITFWGLLAFSRQRSLSLQSLRGQRAA
ncbi:MAG TPA: lysylphosphatidylglycerol synthase transmembrane domain-containing protein [Bryobacteraceae bacterium]|nr:lysylphosphatidylglycerol synthase transmembrane domain-containing protein [Bryobacteraceae bacterium]